MKATFVLCEKQENIKVTNNVVISINTFKDYDLPMEKYGNYLEELFSLKPGDCYQFYGGVYCNTNKERLSCIITES